MNCNLRGLQLAERTQTTLKELHSFNVLLIFEMRSKPERFPDAHHPGSPTYCARIHNSSEEGRKLWLTKCEEATDTCVRPLASVHLRNNFELFGSTGASV